MESMHGPHGVVGIWEGDGVCGVAGATVTCGSRKRENSRVEALVEELEFEKGNQNSSNWA